MLSRIPERIIIEQPQFVPVASFFDGISNKDFLKFIDSLTNGSSAHLEKVHCIFPNDLCEGDLVETGGNIPDGIEFSFDWGEEVYVDIPTFRGFLKMACDAYVKDHPEDRAKIEELLARPQPALFQAETSAAFPVK